MITLPVIICFSITLLKRMNDVKIYQRYGCFLTLLLVALTTACAPVKTLDVWQDEAYTGPLQKVMVIVVTQQENIRNQFENIFSEQLAKRGIIPFPSNKVLSQPIAELDRETVLAKIRELGVSSVLVARSIDKKEIVNHQYGGVYYGGVAIYDNGWHTYAHVHGHLSGIGKTHDVGVDNNNFYPISFTELKEKMKEKPNNINYIRPEDRRK